MSSQKKEIIAMVSKACASRARQSEVCEYTGMSAKII